MSTPRKDDASKDLGEFKPLPVAKLNRLIAKGARDAEALDKVIRSQFELSAADAMIRLR